MFCRIKASYSLSLQYNLEWETFFSCYRRHRTRHRLSGLLRFSNKESELGSGEHLSGLRRETPAAVYLQDKHTCSSPRVCVTSQHLLQTMLICIYPETTRRTWRLTHGGILNDALQTNTSTLTSNLLDYSYSYLLYILLAGVWAHPLSAKTMKTKAAVWRGCEGASNNQHFCSGGNGSAADVWSHSLLRPDETGRRHLLVLTSTKQKQKHHPSSSHLICELWCGRWLRGLAPGHWWAPASLPPPPSSCGQEEEVNEADRGGEAGEQLDVGQSLPDRSRAVWR